MSDHSDGSDMEKDLRESRRKDSVDSSVLPPHPGLRAYRHVSVAHLRETKTILANCGLLEAAEGGYSPRVLLLKDIDISRLHSADPEKMAALRYKAERVNTKNAERRNLWMLQAWTKIYALLRQRQLTRRMARPWWRVYDNVKESAVMPFYEPAV